MSHSRSVRRLTDPEFDALFLNYTAEAFRVETLPSYDAKGDDARFAAFRRDRKQVVPPNQDFLQYLSQCRNEGRPRICLRVIPDSPRLDLYIQYEVEWCFPFNIAAGMEARFVLPENFTPGIRARMGRDFWLFDSTTGVEMKYDSRGKYEAADLITNSQDIEELCARRNEYIAASIDAPTFLEMYRRGKFEF